MIVVSDTSPITSLISIQRVSLLEQMYGEILIPRSVHQELVRAHAFLPPFLETRDVSDRQSVLRLAAELDEGEAEAIVLAKESQADLLLIDERPGRLVAEREGVRIAGLVGVLVEAKRRGILPSAREIISSLESDAGFRLSERLKIEAFLAAGE